MIKNNFLISEETLKRILLENFIVDKNDLFYLEKESKKANKPFLKLLFEKNFISENYLTKLIADFLKIPFIDLSLVKIKKECFRLVPKIICKEKRIVPFFRERGKLFLAMANPADKRTILLTESITGLKVVSCLASEKSIFRTIFKLENGFQGKIKEVIQRNIKKVLKGGVEGKKETREIIDTIIVSAFFERASEILFEETEKNILVRFRIDGILREAVNLPIKSFPSFSEDLRKRLKIPSKIKEFSGSFYFDIDKEPFLIGVFVSASFFRRIRILIPQEAYSESGLSELSLRPADITRLKKEFEKPGGIIVISGPKNSGKTTFLYTILRLFNQEEKNICTFEECPRESVRRITQVGRGIIKGTSDIDMLKAVLRIKPEILVVDGVSSPEFFEEISLYSFAGNLVILKMESGNAFGALFNLLNLTGEKYLGVESLKIIIAERLIRRICPFCKEEADDEGLLLKLKNIALRENINIDKFFMKEPKFYTGKGCPHCHFSGFQKQIGIFETLNLDNELKEVLKRENPSSLVKEKAYRNNFVSFLEDSLGKAVNGETSISEVLKIFNN